MKPMYKYAAYSVFAATTVATIGVWAWLSVHAPGSNAFAGSLAAQLGLYGRLSGLLLALTFIFLLLSMGKGRTLEKFIPKSELIKIHRKLGMATVVLLIIHMALIFTGRSILYDETIFQPLRDFAFDKSWGSTAITGAVMLIAILIFCAFFILKRIKFQGWKKSHYFVYPMILLLFFHQIFYGADFAGNTAFRWFWIIIFVVASADAAIWKYKLLIGTNKVSKSR